MRRTAKSTAPTSTTGIKSSSKESRSSCCFCCFTEKKTNSGYTVIITGKGAEWYQEIQGIHHRYNDVPVAAEVLAGDVRSHE